jgi:hypothetical protein
MEPELCVKCGRRLSCYLRDAICFGDGRHQQPIISLSYCNRFYQQRSEEIVHEEVNLEAVAGLLA